MKKLLNLVFMLLLMFETYAKEVIVMHNGDVVESIIIEITQTEVKYKKASRPNGPTYTIDKSDVLSINYEDGEKETFNESIKKALPEKEKDTGIVAISVSDLNKNELTMNGNKIAFYNQTIDRIPDEKKDKQKCGSMRYRFFVDENSIIENKDVEIILTGVSIIRDKKDHISDIYETEGWNYLGPGIKCSIRNKTNTTLYLDLGNCFFTRLGKPICYYTPSSTTTSSSTSHGGSVNLGAITGALGVGGTVGTLANGINVGGGTTSGSSTTIYAQRVVSVPPMSTYALPELFLISERVDKGDEYLAPGCKFNINGIYTLYNGRLILNFPKKSSEGPLKYNEELIYSPENSPLKMSFVITYSNKETFEIGNALPVGIYLGSVVGVHNGKSPFGENNNKKGLLWFTGLAHDNDKEPSARP